MQDYWQQQKPSEPLFPDILWARPENRQAAGKLLIVGGNVHGFSDVGQAYQEATKAGAGTVRIVLPDALRKTVGMSMENCEFAPSTPSGSFAKTALNELLVQAEWADCVLLAGEFGRNSETAMLLEAFVQKYQGLLVITRDALEYFYAHASLLLDRKDTCIVGSTNQLQKLATNARFTKAITTSSELTILTQVLHEFSQEHTASLVTHQLGVTIVTVKGRISTTKTGSSEDVWRVPTAARASVFWTQNPSKAFEALTTSLSKY